MILVVNSGIGNVMSVEKMLKKAGAEAKISDCPDAISRADKIVLPGVGSFDTGMNLLSEKSLIECLNYFALKLQKPVLGICMGSQIIGEKSEEGARTGLSWVRMKCKKFRESSEFRVPHMGWGTLKLPNKDARLFKNLRSNARFYFVHSYYMEFQNSSAVSAYCDYGGDFPCAFEENNIFGVQFHPEKSLVDGLSVMRAFAEL